MREIMAIAQREFVVRVFRRAFFIGSLIAPIIVLLCILLPQMFFGGPPVERQVVVLDQTGDPTLFEALLDRVRSAAFETQFILSQEVVPPEEDLEDAIRQKDWQLANNASVAVLALPARVLDDAQPEYYATNVSDMSLTSLSQTVSRVITARRLMKLGIDPRTVSQSTEGAELKMIKVTAEGTTRQERQDIILPLVLFLLMYFAVSGQGQRVMMGLLEEKQSKVVEIVISSVKPFQLMLGKLFGIGLVGLTRLSLWALTVPVTRLLAGRFLGQNQFNIPLISNRVLIAFLVYFILGYFMFGTIYAIVGGMITRMEDIVYFQRPLSLLYLVPLITVWIILRDPNSPLSVALSLFPLFGPSLMLIRTVIMPPPIWQFGLSIALMLLAIAGAIWVAAKVYRMGILLNGTKPTLAQIGRWLRYA